MLKAIKSQVIIYLSHPISKTHVRLLTGLCLFIHELVAESYAHQQVGRPDATGGGLSAWRNTCSSSSHVGGVISVAALRVFLEPMVKWFFVWKLTIMLNA